MQTLMYVYGEKFCDVRYRIFHDSQMELYFVASE